MLVRMLQSGHFRFLGPPDEIFFCIPGLPGIWGQWIVNILQGGPERQMCYMGQSSSMKHMQVSGTTKWYPCPNDDSSTSLPMCFISVGLNVSGALFPPDQQMPWMPIQYESELACEKYRNILLFSTGKVLSCPK